MDITPRFPSICTWCSYGCTLPTDEHGPSVTWCSNDHFENPGENHWPEKKECADFEMNKGVNAMDFKFWPYAWKVTELNNLLIEDSIKQLNNHYKPK